MTKKMRRYFKIAVTKNVDHDLLWWQREMLDKFREGGIEVVELNGKPPRRVLGVYHTILAFYFPVKSLREDQKYIKYVNAIYLNNLVQRVVFYDQYGQMDWDTIHDIENSWNKRPGIYHGLALSDEYTEERYTGILYPPMWNVDDDPRIDITEMNRPVISQRVIEQRERDFKTVLSNTSFLRIINPDGALYCDYITGTMPAYVSKAVDHKNIAILVGFNPEVENFFAKDQQDVVLKSTFGHPSMMNTRLYAQYQIIKEHADYRKWIHILIGGLS